MNKKIGALIFLIVLTTTFVSAEAFFSNQPNEVYTLGESLNFAIGVSTEGWTNVNLICGDQEKMLDFGYVTEPKKTFSIPLTSSFLGELNGQCHLELIYEDNAPISSINFDISSNIKTDIKFNALSFEPDSTLTFDGTATKESKSKVNGFIELSFEGTEISAVVPIVDGTFSGELQIPSSMAAGEYLLKTFAYEKQGEEVTNYGTANNTQITIIQVPMSLNIEAPEKIKPNNDLEFKAQLYDQTRQTIDGEQVSFKLTNIDGEEVLNILSKTGDSNTYKIRKDAPVGYWNLTATSAQLTEEIKVFVEENMEASFQIVNNTLIITNIGNVPYDNFVEIVIKGSQISDVNENTTESNSSEFKEIKYLNISLGSSVELELSAPDGEYQVSVADKNQQIQETTMLTGRTIAINSPGGISLGIFNKNFLVWSFLILTLGLFIFISARKVINRKMTLSQDKFSPPEKKQGGVVKIKPVSEKKVEVETEESGQATPSLVINGTKQESSIISLKIKNKNELTDKNSQKTISDAIKEIAENNGKIYKSEDYIIGIFAPVITRTFNNQLTALKIANSISDKLAGHNSKFNQKIEYGIGVSVGDMVTKKEGGNLLFTTLGNGLTGAKKISEIAENKVLISEEINKRVIPKAKTTMNPEKFGMKTYSVDQIVDREQNQKFISQFLERNKEYKKLDDFKLGK